MVSREAMVSTVHEAWTGLSCRGTWTLSRVVNGATEGSSRKEHRGTGRFALSCWVVRPVVGEAGVEGGSEQMRRQLTWKGVQKSPMCLLWLRGCGISQGLRLTVSHFQEVSKHKAGGSSEEHQFHTLRNTKATGSDYF